MPLHRSCITLADCVFRLSLRPVHASAFFACYEGIKFCNFMPVTRLSSAHSRVTLALFMSNSFFLFPDYGHRVQRFAAFDSILADSEQASGLC